MEEPRCTFWPPTALWARQGHCVMVPWGRVDMVPGTWSQAGSASWHKGADRAPFSKDPAEGALKPRCLLLAASGWLGGQEWCGVPRAWGILNRG